MLGNVLCFLEAQNSIFIMPVFFGRNSGYSRFLKFDAELCEQSALSAHIFTHADLRKCLNVSMYQHCLTVKSLQFFALPLHH